MNGLSLHTHLRIACTLICCAIWTVCSARAQSTDAMPEVLVINSYHPGFAWSDGEMNGILETFRKYNKRIPIYIEYLDTKRHYQYELLDLQAEILKTKYSAHSISVIMAADNNALDFALEHRDEIAPQAPIVFCGINGFSTNLLQGQTNVLGVIESSDPTATLEIAQKLCPWIKSVYVIHDYTPTGMANRKAFQDIQATIFTNLEFQYSPDLPMEELLGHIEQLPDDTIIFQGILIVDSTGKIFELEEISTLLNRHANVPVFPLNETMFAAGGIGGALNSPYMEGKTGAELAISILEGTPIEELPITRESPLRLLFNYQQLDRYNLDETELPMGSTITNRPATLYAEYPTLIWSIILMFLISTALISFLLRNIIKRRRVEQELFRHRQHLEQLVIERTRKLETTHERLEQRANDLKRANEYKSQFLAHISHEVRTPLNAIIGFSEIILYSKSLDFIHQQSRIILNETEHLLSIINQLLDHAKMESGKFILEHKPFDLEQFIASIQKSLRHHVLRKNITMECSVAADIPHYIIGDPLRLRQVLINLLTNAIKFTQQGSVSLDVQHVYSNNSSSTLRFSITDTGIGIPAEKLHTIFHHFSQMDDSTTRKFGGTGLGTAIAYGLVELMGGKLEVTSTEGKGSTFFFEINVTVPKEISPKELVALSPLDINISNNEISREAHILVADDYASNQSVVRIHLQNAGYTCSIAENGAEAVSMCEQEHFDLILMDISMPVLDGYEATQKIRAAKTGNSRIPILALSAHAGDHVRQKCIESGMNDIIIKPIHRSSFIQQIDHWLTLNELSVTAPRVRSADHTEGRHVAAGTPMDYALAVHEFADREDLVLEALKHFVNDTRRLLPTMRIACQDLDPDYIMKEAHKIAGAAGNLRATALFDSCKQLEELCMTGQPNPGEVMNFLSQVIDCFDDLMCYLKEKKILD